MYFANLNLKWKRISFCGNIFFNINPALNLQLERAFQKQQETEMAARLAEKERLERERLEARKRKEVQRITDVCYINYLKFFYQQSLFNFN